MIELRMVPVSGELCETHKAKHFAVRTRGQWLFCAQGDRVAIGWKGHYRIEGPAFVYVDRDTGRTSTILGYPTNQLTRIG
jgi:hypothetical protein